MLVGGLFDVNDVDNANNNSLRTITINGFTSWLQLSVTSYFFWHCKNAEVSATTMTPTKNCNFYTWTQFTEMDSSRSQYMLLILYSQL